VKRAIYPGTFDPITYGHIDILKKATQMFDEVILAVASETGKNTFFTFEERVSLCRACCADIPGVRVEGFEGLVVEYARRLEVCDMVRGVRAVSDFEYELQLALMNRMLDRGIETVFLVPDHYYLYLSSSMVRQIVRLGGSLDTFVPPMVDELLRKRFKGDRDGAEKVERED